MTDEKRANAGRSGFLTIRFYDHVDADERQHIITSIYAQNEESIHGMQWAEFAETVDEGAFHRKAVELVESGEVNRDE